MMECFNDACRESKGSHTGKEQCLYGTEIAPGFKTEEVLYDKSLKLDT